MLLYIRFIDKHVRMGRPMFGGSMYYHYKSFHLTVLMKPYPHKGLAMPQYVYNYRLSRSQRTIENAFGVLSARWRIFHRAIRADYTTVDLIVKLSCCDPPQ